jgi:transposase
MNKTRRDFTPEVKQEAVALLRSSGCPLTQVAGELGIQPSMLRSWRRRQTGQVPRPQPVTAGTGSVASPSAAASSPADQAAEIARLRRELERARLERDILKKAMVGSTGQRNMIDFMMFRKDPRWREPADLAYRRGRKGSFGSDGRTASRSVTSDGLSASTRAQSLVCCKPKVALRRRCGSDLPAL